MESRSRASGKLRWRLSRLFCRRSALLSSCGSNDAPELPDLIPSAKYLHHLLDRSVSFPSSDCHRSQPPRPSIDLGCGTDRRRSQPPRHSIDLGCGAARRRSQPPRHSIDLGCGAARLRHHSSSSALQPKKGRVSTPPASLMNKEKWEPETGEEEGRQCPHASPALPARRSLNYRCSFDESDEGEEKKMASTTTTKKKKLLSNGYGFSSSTSIDSDDDGLIFSSDEGNQAVASTETRLSCKSFSSDSSEFYRRVKKSSKKKTKNSRVDAGAEKSRPLTKKYGSHGGFRPLTASAAAEKEEEEEEKGFAVAKRSMDPYTDFQSSMVEMIMEGSIFAARDLEKLLQSYISLNSRRHHPVILRAFADVWAALFSN